MEKTKILIIGSGPAGIATATAVHNLEPSLRESMIILEKAHHPRHKLCGGGITPFAEETLNILQLDSHVPSVPIHNVCFYIGDRPLLFNKANLMRVIRRNQFDAQLVASARDRGIQIREGECVRDIRRIDNGIEVITDSTRYHTQILVGADGANGVVRSKMLPQDVSRVSRLMEVLVPVEKEQTSEFTDSMVVFDFRPMSEDLQGYVWDFPCYVDGKAFLNIGIFDSRIHNKAPRAKLKTLLERHILQRGISLEAIVWQGHPERWFHYRGNYSAPHVLLVGDAAGIEPWLGEGISIALGYGPVAGQMIVNALKEKDFTFSNYKKKIMNDRLGYLLKRNRLIASYFYRKKSFLLLPIFGKILKWMFEYKKGKS